jgi:Holliday junction resolvase
MSGKRSRRRGAEGERELARVISSAGFSAARTARNGITSEDVTHNIPGVHIECKRTERYSIDEWIRQAEGDAGELTPLIVFRKNGQPWRAVVPFDYLLQLLKERQ